MNFNQMILEDYGESMEEFFESEISKEDYFLAYKLLSSSFAPNRYLMDDIKREKKLDIFKEFIKKNINTKETYNLEETFFKSGYLIYECETLEEINHLKKHFNLDDLITQKFKDIDIYNYKVYIAVKNDIYKIRFESSLEIEYDNSVLAFTFTKEEKLTRFKVFNRLGNVINIRNVDSIIKNASDALNSTLELKENSISNSDFLEEFLNGYVLDSDGKLHKILHVISDDNEFKCTSFNNIIIEGSQVNKKFFDNQRYILADDYVIDLEQKEIFSLCKDYNIKDSFINCFNDIKSIEVIYPNYGTSKYIVIKKEWQDNIIIGINEFNQIISYVNNNLIEIGNNFMFDNKSLEYIEMRNVEKIGKYFLFQNIHLKEAVLPNLKEILPYAFYLNLDMEAINLPKCEVMGKEFMYENKKLKIFNAPNVKKIDEKFLFYNECLEEFICKNLVFLGEGCLIKNNKLQIFFAPALTDISNCCLEFNNSLKLFYVPNLRQVGYSVLKNNMTIEEFGLPLTFKVEEDFLHSHKAYNKNVKNLGNRHLLLKQVLKH